MNLPKLRKMKKNYILLIVNKHLMLDSFKLLVHHHLLLKKMLHVLSADLMIPNLEDQKRNTTLLNLLTFSKNQFYSEVIRLRPRMTPLKEIQKIGSSNVKTLKEKI